MFLRVLQEAFEPRHMRARLDAAFNPFEERHELGRDARAHLVVALERTFARCGASAELTPPLAVAAFDAAHIAPKLSFGGEGRLSALRLAAEASRGRQPGVARL